MSDALREPIARALWERDMVGLHDLTGRFDEQDPRDLEGYFDAADAVLSVLHEAGEQGDVELENCRRRIANQRKELDALRVAHSGTRAVELAEEASRYRAALSNIRFRMNGGGELDPATLRSIVDVALASPAVAGEQESDQ
jgi:hypothetical protein